MFNFKRISLLVTCASTLALSLPARAQIVDPISLDIRGRETQYARGVMNGNLVESNFRNHGEVSRYQDTPWGVWPRGTGNRHVDGIGFYVLGRVMGDRLNWPQFWPEAIEDTMLAHTMHNYRPDAGGRRAPFGPTWGWLPLPGLHNSNRIDPVTFQRDPQPAMSTDPSTWPDDWPDKRDNPDDPGWPGNWNGYFGKGVFQADLESYYVIDDHGDYEYQINLATGQPFSPNAALYYPSTADSTIGGLGLMVKVRNLQWANILAEDTMFMLYEIVNRGGYFHGGQPDEGLYFMKIIDYGMGDETDGVGEFDPRFDIAFGYDISGDGPDATGRIYPIGYSGFAFLESPARSLNNQDDDEDGVTDERRDSGAGIRIEGQDQIRAYAEANYNMANFETFEAGNATGPLEDREAYQAGVWWTGDENMNWRSFEDANENGVYDEGEFPNSDVGRDGLGAFDFTYPGPDEGELDGIPNPGEPNFDRTDIDESDQIGLRGFDLDTRPVYQNGDNLSNDFWLWDRVEDDALFPLGTGRTEIVAGIEPFLMFVSGPVPLEPESIDYFSLGWLFGENREDFYRNRLVVQRIYNANYRFAQPPIMPTLTATPGDGQVIVAWDTVSTQSFDRFSRTYDFEGYRLYRGTDPLLNDIRSISDVDGTPTFYKPLAQWDLDNGISGPVPVFENRSVFDLGDDTGLQFFYIDSTVSNGVRYYYTVTAYDHGVIDTVDVGVINVDIDPQENIFNFQVDAFLQIRSTSRNAAAVTPKARAAGFIPGGTNENTEHVTGYGTGSISVTIVDDAQVDYGGVYRMSFVERQLSPEPALDYITTGYSLSRIDNGGQILAAGELQRTTPFIEGFLVNVFNDENIEIDENSTGWVGNYGDENETFNTDPSRVDGYSTNWEVEVDFPGTQGENWIYTPDNFELIWTDTLSYYPPRFQTNRFLRDSINVIAVNRDQSEAQGQVVQVEILIDDLNGNGEFDHEDALIVVERSGARRLRQRVRFRVPNGVTSIPPGQGNYIRISNNRPFRSGDYFDFTISQPTFDEELAKGELDRIRVVPNPYIASNILEFRSQTQTGNARAERRIMFNHLPAKCTISIYNLRGELVRKINRDAPMSDGTEYWDLLNRDNQDVAYGVYIFHVKAPGIGEKVGKFALIK